MEELTKASHNFYILLNTLNTELKFDLRINDFDWTHQFRIAGAIRANRKSRPMIIKFVYYIVCRNVFNHKKMNNLNISIIESLTKTQMVKLTKTREQHRF